MESKETVQQMAKLMEDGPESLLPLGHFITGSSCQSESVKQVSYP